jgi:hypothetical protein
VSRVLANASAKDRPATDFYATPEAVTHALMRELDLPFHTSIWEPACGDGRMVNVLHEYSSNVIATDISSGHDFLNSNIQVDWIITNPPFILSHKFIEHAYELGVEGFAFLLKSQYWHSAKRESLFRSTCPYAFYPLTWRADFLFGAKGGGPTMDVAWVVWKIWNKSPCIFKPLIRPKGITVAATLVTEMKGTPDDKQNVPMVE